MDPDRREQLVRRLQGFFLKEFDEGLHERETWG